jgi:hypothetical protein
LRKEFLGERALAEIFGSGGIWRNSGRKIKLIVKIIKAYSQKIQPIS